VFPDISGNLRYFGKSKRYLTAEALAVVLRQAHGYGKAGTPKNENFSAAAWQKNYLNLNTDP
jgi:hypothetical protein